MKLADLEILEREIADRGWRVRYRNGTEDYQYLPDLEENGAPDHAGAVEWMSRLVVVAKYKGLKDLEVVGPDLEPPTDQGVTYRWLPPDNTPASAAAEEPPPSAAAPTQTRRFGATNANPNRMAGGIDLTDDVPRMHTPAEWDGIAEELAVDPDARHAIDGIPLQGGTVLAEQDGLCLVGDSNAQVYVCPKEALEGVQGINWRPKVKRMENVIMGPGDDGRGGGAHVPWLNWTGQGITARAAFHNAAGLWLVLRR